jgi:hypothetical protein
MVPDELSNLLSSPEFPRIFHHIKGSEIESLETPGIPPRWVMLSNSPDLSFELEDPDDREEWETLLVLYEENSSQILMRERNILSSRLVCRIVNTVPDEHSSELLRLYSEQSELTASLLELGVPSKRPWEIERNGSITDGPGGIDGRS